MHTSVDDYVAGPNGEMDWIKVEDELFDYGEQFTQAAYDWHRGRIYKSKSILSG